MSAITNANAINGFWEIFKQMFTWDGVVIADPYSTSNGYRPYFSFEFGKRPEDAKRRYPKIYCLPGGKSDTDPGMCLAHTEIHYFTFGILSAADDEQSQRLFYKQLDRLKYIFGINGHMIEYQRAIRITETGYDKPTTRPAPTSLAGLGIQKCQIISSSNVDHLGKEEQPLFRAEILVGFTLYF